MRSPWFLLLSLCLSTASAGTPQKTVVSFSITNDVGAGNEVYVSGSHPDFTSNGVQPLGVKLRWSTGNVWAGSIALEAGAQTSYTFVRHGGTSTGFCSGSSTALSAPANLAVPAAAGPPYPGKFVRYLSSWSTANFYYRDLTQNGGWTTATMQRVGNGRTANESVYQVNSGAPPGDEIEFIFFDGSGHYDNAPAPPQNPPQGAAPGTPVPYQSLTAPYNYRTRLDVFTVQDGQLYNYNPPAAVSAPSISQVFVNSTVTGIPGRYIHIYLPRAYVQNTSKRYPVVYFHDGQNVFFPGGTFGTWDADRIATYETSQGRMREAILVAIDNGNGYGSDRMVEYIPPGDQLSGNPPGTADKYVQFLRDNVLPTLDYNYRTLNPPGQPGLPSANITAGSSLGGLLTAYMGVTNSGVFGKIGVFSPAFFAGPNFVNNTLTPAAKLPLVIYMDVGSTESSASQSSSEAFWQGALGVYNSWVDDGYAVNSELVFYPQCGATHNEAAWSGRLPVFYQFVLSPWTEVNTIALEEFPPQPRMLDVDATGGLAHLQFLAPLGASFGLSRSSDLINWTAPTSLPAATAIWEDRVIEEPFTGGTVRRFWSLTATAMETAAAAKSPFTATVPFSNPSPFESGRVRSGDRKR